MATQIIGMISQAITRHSDVKFRPASISSLTLLKLFFQTCQPFFKILTLLTETSSQSSGGPSGLPCFIQLVLQKVWEAAESCPYSALDWLSLQVTRSRMVHQWVLSSMDSWMEHFLIAHGNQRVRNGNFHSEQKLFLFEVSICYSRWLSLSIVSTKHAIQARFQSDTQNASRTSAIRRSAQCFAPNICRSVATAAICKTLYGYATTWHYEINDIFRATNVLLHIEN